MEDKQSLKTKQLDIFENMKVQDLAEEKYRNGNGELLPWEEEDGKN
jgi:hypothetical protein